MKTIYMEKMSSTGKTLSYLCKINGNEAEFTHGQKGGKLQVEPKTFLNGKNIGRANEKTPEQVCLEFCVLKARKKYEGGYKIIKGQKLIDDNTSKHVNLADVTVPIPMTAQQMKKHLPKLKKLDFIHVQPKLDGNRCIVNLKTGKMYSRSRKEITHLQEISEFVLKACKSISKEVEWVDGELFTPEINFNEIQSVMRATKNIHSERSKLREKLNFYIFDVISDETWTGREKIINKIKPNKRAIVVPSFKIAPNEDEINIWHDKFVKEGYEGAMIRFDNLPYQQKRSLQLFKLKSFEDAEYMMVGIETEKNNANILGTIIMEDRETGERFPSSPAMSDERKKEIMDNLDDYIGRIGTVKFQEKNPSGTPRFSNFMRFRLEEDMGE